MISRYEEFKAAFDAYNAKHPLRPEITVAPGGSQSQYIDIFVDGVKRGQIERQDISSPTKPWSVKIGNLRELKFTTPANVAKAGFWVHDLKRRP